MSYSKTSAPKACVFNIPASTPFLPALTSAIVEGRLIESFSAGGDPLALARLTLYLPTRRACRLARDAFLGTARGSAAILPRIVAIGDVDEDELIFERTASGEDALALPPALDPLERRLRLAALVSKWASSPGVRTTTGSPLVASTPAAALRLADDLARLIDDMTTRQVPWDKLDTLVPEEHDKYWQLTLDFLKIARDFWPAQLKELGAIEAAARRDLLIEAETKRLARADAPVIAAGSTGSMPATAKLLAAIAALPHGAVVLPGLDKHLDDASWTSLGGEDAAHAAGHPQFAMQALLARIGIPREAVKDLVPAAAHGRERVLSEALRPAAKTDLWRERLAGDFTADAERALQSVTTIEADNANEEALAIAVALRETAETSGRTAALVTPDRALARRVVAALRRWNVPVDDSGGDPLGETRAGVFARMAAEGALDGLPPVGLLALLKHPLLRLDGGTEKSIAVLELALLRGPRPRPGTAGLTRALAALRQNKDKLHPADPRGSLTDGDLDLADALLRQLAAALEPLEELPKNCATFAALAARHREVLAALGGDAVFAGRDGNALDAALRDIAESSSAKALVVEPRDYPELLHTALTATVRRPEIKDVRVRVIGPLESRLQDFDRVVLGGLVEGVWPPETAGDPWLSRPMRHALGLDLPERRIGLSAHDFAQALGAREVILTRAAKLAGAPTVPSRFAQRLAAVAGEKLWKDAIARGETYLRWARTLDDPQTAPEPVKRPEPTPPRDARPTRISVTDVEHWLRDPYTIYAKHILKLRPLDPVDTPPGARDRGTVIHGAIGDFTQAFAKEAPEKALDELLALGRKHFAVLEDYPEARAFWWPRFERIAQWFVGWEKKRRDGLAGLHGEIAGKHEIDAGSGRKLVLSARADRIEQTAQGYAILDYKTGSIRTAKQVKSGIAPQLALEAAILRQGGFVPLKAGAITHLVYVALKGAQPAGKEDVLDFEDMTANDVAEKALQSFIKLVQRFEDEKTGYASLQHPLWKTHYGDYDHLARVKEWSLFGGADEEFE